MLDGTVRCRLLAVTISHYVVVNRWWCELVLIIVKQILLLQVRLHTPILHLCHKVDSCAPAGSLQWEYLLLIFQGLRVYVVHAALREVSRRSQVTYPYICGCVMFCQRSSGFIIICSKRLICWRSTLTIVFLLRTRVVWTRITPFLLRGNVFLWTCSCI